MEKFLAAYPPAPAEPVAPKLVARYRDLLPAPLLNLWQQDGFCEFGGGLLRLINPDTYREALETWLGDPKPNYVPIALSAFGDLFYYRRLTDTDEDVCLLDPHYRQITTCAWSLVEFFDGYLLEDEVRELVLREPLLAQARQQLGPLLPDEQYCFVPALALGGAETVDYLAKGNAPIHLEVLFQLTS